MGHQRGCDPSRNAEVVWTDRDKEKGRDSVKKQVKTVSWFYVLSACLWGPEMAHVASAHRIVNIALLES